jgi:hypothetical protein
VLGVRRWRELVTGKNGGILFDRPKPTAGCSASGEEVIMCTDVNKTWHFEVSC